MRDTTCLGPQHFPEAKNTTLRAPRMPGPDLLSPVPASPKGLSEKVGVGQKRCTGAGASLGPRAPSHLQTKRPTVGSSDALGAQLCFRKVCVHEQELEGHVQK